MFSGYRDPVSDAARCETEHNCDGAHRASCSAHRTGTAIDLDVGFMPEPLTADNATTDNRMLHEYRTPAYRWMVANASRFGFVNYAFEPWHWEYVKGPLPATAPPEPVVAAPTPTPTTGPGPATSPTPAAPFVGIQGPIVTLPNAKPGPAATPPPADTPQPHHP